LSLHEGVNELDQELLLPPRHGSLLKRAL